MVRGQPEQDASSDIEAAPELGAVERSEHAVDDSDERQHKSTMGRSGRSSRPRSGAQAESRRRRPSAAPTRSLPVGRPCGRAARRPGGLAESRPVGHIAGRMVRKGILYVAVGFTVTMRGQEGGAVGSASSSLELGFLVAQGGGAAASRAVDQTTGRPNWLAGGRAQGPAASVGPAGHCGQQLGARHARAPSRASAPPTPPRGARRQEFERAKRRLREATLVRDAAKKAMSASWFYAPGKKDELVEAERAIVEAATSSPACARLLAAFV